ncbi:MAG: GldG family protein, partial [Oscillospiraceae bacterium]|nr:GldG family protein [Oscillospiraceae bacterium]
MNADINNANEKKEKKKANSKIDSDNSNKTNKTDKKESHFKRKFKYGAVAMIFTIIFVAVVVLVNVVTTTVNNINPLMIDMTKKQIYSISDSSKNLLKDINAPVEIVFFMPIDMYEKTVQGGKMIVDCIKSFANTFNNITIRTVDIIKNPAAANEFKTSEISQLKTTSIAVKSGSTPKLLDYTAFYVIAQSDNSAMGFAGERTLTSAILQVTNTDSPIVYFTTGHGEAALTDNGLADLFAQNGFTVKQIDLTTEDIDPTAKIVVICNPRKDFLGTDPNNPNIKSEIDKIGSFLNNFGNLMYFTSPDLQGVDLPELNDLLKEYNIQMQGDSMIVDTKNALDSTGLALNAQYFVSNGAGDELTASIRSLPSAPRT